MIRILATCLFLLSSLHLVHAQDTTVITIHDSEWFDSNNYNYVKETCAKSGTPFSYTGIIRFSKNLPLDSGVVKLLSYDSSAVRVIGEFKNHQLNGYCLTYYPSNVNRYNVQLEEIYQNGKMKFRKLYGHFGVLKDHSNFAFKNARKTDRQKVISFPDSIYTLQLGVRLSKAPKSFKFTTEEYDTIVDNIEAYSNVKILTLNHDRSSTCTLTEDQAKSIFERLSLFKNLERLEAYHFSCPKFPSEILKITTLKYLSIGRLTDGYIPREISGLSELRYLELNGTKLILPYSLRDLNYLQELKMSSPQDDMYFSSKGKPLAPNLTDLHIYCGYSTSGKIYGIQTLSKLEMLEIEKGSVMNDLSSLKALRKFGISDQKITALPTGLHNCDKLENLAIMSPNVRDIDERIFDLPNLKRVKLWRSALPKEKMDVLKEKYPHIDITILGR